MKSCPKDAEQLVERPILDRVQYSYFNIKDLRHKKVFKRRHWNTIIHTQWEQKQ